MQPTYTLLSSVGASPWKTPNWHITPQEISFQIISGGSSYSIAVTLEDPTGTYPSPNSSAPTAFTIFSGTSNAIFSIGSSITAPLTEPIAGYRLSVGSLSSVGASVLMVTIQSGIG